MARRRGGRGRRFFAAVVAIVVVIVLVRSHGGVGSLVGSVAGGVSSVVKGIGAGVVASGGSAGPATSGAAVDGAAGSGGTGATAASILARLPVKGRAPLTGYDRVGDFGEAWTDVDANGCDTRNDILARDLTGTDIAPNCYVESGTLVSPYDGSTVAFTRGYETSEAVQIDHVVALADAWQTGAQQISETRRIALANDPLNLFAVDGASNQQKGAADAASWLPANRAFRCEYVSHQVAVKAKYGLWVTTAEQAAISRVLATCPGFRVP